MIPGLPQDLLQGSDEEGSMRLKRMIYITDSMTAVELDSDGSLFMEMGKDGKPIGLTWRVTRVARGSGTSVREVEELLCQYRMMANMAKQAGGKNGWFVIWHFKLLQLTLEQVTSDAKGTSRCGWQRTGSWRHAHARADTGDAGRTHLLRGQKTYKVKMDSVRCRPECCNRCNVNLGPAAECRK